jgi:enoyl-CoA hydratase/carnithine racemase
MSQVRFEREGAVGSIVLNHPPQNRIGHQMMLDLTGAVAEASVSDIRVLLVRGDGSDFSFGGDVREWPDATPEELRSFVYRVTAAFHAIELLPIPTVAVIQGAAYGGGFELALSCDLILAAESAHFRFVEATIAVPPLAGGVHVRVGRPAGRGEGGRRHRAR